MGEVVNLNKFRKAKAKAEAKASAGGNRALFGRTKGETAKQKADRERAERNLDGARREDD